MKEEDSKPTELITRIPELLRRWKRQRAQAGTLLESNRGPGIEVLASSILWLLTP